MQRELRLASLRLAFDHQILCSLNHENLKPSMTRFNRKTHHILHVSLDVSPLVFDFEQGRNTRWAELAV
jgi:hypothetical protein